MGWKQGCGLQSQEVKSGLRNQDHVKKAGCGVGDAESISSLTNSLYLFIQFLELVGPLGLK